MEKKHTQLLGTLQVLDANKKSVESESYILNV